MTTPISVTYTFSNNTAADATQQNTNFTDITNGLSLSNRDILVRDMHAVSAVVSNLVHTGDNVGFYGVTATAQTGAITAPSTVTECISACVSLINVLQNLGLTA